MARKIGRDKAGKVIRLRARVWLGLYLCKLIRGFYSLGEFVITSKSDVPN